MKRDISIDLLKFLAVVFVVNSHLDVCYPTSCRMLATGGAIGDALFFFCSGFTLFLGRDMAFGSWYKRRLARILPSVIVCVLTYACWYGNGWYDHVGGYWFVRCILIYYVLLYPIKKYFKERMWIPFAVVILISCSWWFVFENPQTTIYSNGYFMWSHYFLPMLLGAYVGLRRAQIHVRPICDFFLLGACLGAYLAFWRYGLNHVGYGWMQLLSIPCLSATVYFIYRLANSTILIKYSSSIMGRFMIAVGGLCLEVYLSHRAFLTERWNHLFPLNIVFVFIFAILLAYVVRCLSRIMVQVLTDSEDFDWRAVFKLS